MKIIRQVFMECVRAINQSEMIERVSSTDKEYSFQNWFANRLNRVGLSFDEPSRNAYPDFRLVHHPIGFEIKGLGFPGREANYDCNSQVPSGLHNGREIFYVFGRYPFQTSDRTYPVYDLVFCHGNFLNADHNYVHENKNIKGFGSYGDIMVRDRKMYVAPTPFALTTGTERQITLIASPDFETGRELQAVGDVDRIEAPKLVSGYHFNMVSRVLTPSFVDNPHAGKTHRFSAFRPANSTGPTVSLR